jgi:hypothetical protein
MDFFLLFFLCGQVEVSVNCTSIKREASVAVLLAVESDTCALLLIGGAHVAGKSRDRLI